MTEDHLQDREEIEVAVFDYDRYTRDEYVPVQAR